MIYLMNTIYSRNVSCPPFFCAFCYGPTKCKRQSCILHCFSTKLFDTLCQKAMPLMYTICPILWVKYYLSGKYNLSNRVDSCDLSDEYNLFKEYNLSDEYNLSNFIA